LAAQVAASAGGSTGLIVDTLDRDDTRQFGVCGRFGRFAEPRTGRSEPGEAATAIDEPHVAVVEAHDMVAGLEFGDAQELASQYFADEETVTFPHDLARGTHAADLVIGVVPRVLNAIRHGSLRWHVEFVRGSLAQRFVRALLVVVPAEGVEAGLLFGRVRRGWARRLCLERAMHALMSAILLRRGRMDEVRLDAELDPPRRQARKTACAARPERRPIIAADRKRQAMSVKCLFKDRLRSFDRLLHDPHIDQKTTVAIRYRQGVDPAAVCRAEPNQPLKSVAHSSLAAATAVTGRF